MSVTVQIPTPLRSFAGNQAEVVVGQAATVGEAIEGVVEQHPALKKHLFTDDGALRNFVNIFVNDEDIRHLQGDSTAVAAGDSVLIIPSIAGGRERAG